MKRKRLNRDGWGFQHFPYYQMRIERPDFSGLVCLIRLTDGHECCWHMPRAGRIAVCGAGMTWLQLVPDGAHHIVTAKISPRDRVNIWYADVIDGVEYDPDGVAVFRDLYLDVIFSPKGDLRVDDVDELDDALKSGDITKVQHTLALEEGERIQCRWYDDLQATQRLCIELLQEARLRFDHPDTLRLNV